MNSSIISVPFKNQKKSNSFLKKIKQFHFMFFFLILLKNFCLKHSYITLIKHIKVSAFSSAPTTPITAV